jgi:23S rRNA pseudouridine1911/1915/1917 synthase
MSNKAKQRAWKQAFAPGGDEEPEAPPPGPRAPLTAAEGPQAFEVDASGAGERLDRFLGRAATERHFALSRTRLKVLVEAGQIRVDGAVVLDPATKLAEGAVVAFEAPAAEESALIGEDIPLSIVFEDEHLIVIDKPAGLVVHPAPGHREGTLVNALIRHCGASLSGIGGVKRPGIVHRIDKDTSGLLVVAKTDAAHQGLADLFADHGRSGSLERAYLALVWGGFDLSAGKVDAAIARHPAKRERMAIVPEGRGRHAVTHWRVEEASLGPACLVACELETGRTHQIRVHMASIGHPLLGDSVYGAGFKTKARLLPEAAQTALDALGRQALHAAILGFEHPITGEPLRFESKLPQDFSNLLKALK